MTMTNRSCRFRLTNRRRFSISKSSRTKQNRRARFNEATLLSAMEGAGKLVEDEELREAMSDKGLGTPATRAAIIEGLISRRLRQSPGPGIDCDGERAWR